MQLRPGVFYLCVRRIGFLARRDTIRVGARAYSDTLHVVLEAAANELRGLVVTSDRGEPMTSTLTTATVRQAPPLGEADIFRTMSLLPEVLQANDISGRVHLAGGASDEHAITLDGHPLQSPFHAANLIGAFNVAALDRAELRVHHLPADRDGHLSGDIRLETLRPGLKPSRELVLTLLSASATIAQPLPGEVDVLVSGRTSYIDKVLASYLRQSGAQGDDLIFPGFSDLLVRAGRQWRSGWHAEALGYVTRDAASALNVQSDEQPARWGEQLAGVNLRYRAPSWSMHALLSTSRARAERRELFRALAEDSAELEDSRIVQDWTTGSLTLERRLNRLQLRSGIGFRVREHAHRWGELFADQLLRSAVPPALDTVTRQTIANAFADGVWRVGERWAVSGGAHVSRIASSWYTAPRLQLTYTWARPLAMHLAFDRRHQFDAIAGEPLEGSVTQPVFLLTRPRVADVAALSVDWHPSAAASQSQLRASAAVYARAYRDRTLAVSGGTYGTGMDSAGGAGFLRIPGRTFGAQLTASFATPTGAAVQLSYTGQRASEKINDTHLPTAWDSPHQLSAFTSLPLSSAWRVTAAAQMRSGTAVTPVAVRTFVPLLDNNRYLTRFVYGGPRSARLPGYARVDLGAQYEWSARGADWTFSMQIVNALARVNGLEYDWRQYFACVDRPEFCSAGGAERRSLPLLPSLGVSVRW